MSVFLAGCLALMMVINVHRCGTVPPTPQTQTQQVAKDFSYPESPETVKNGNPYKAKSLDGKVSDPTGAGLERVLVERLSPGWKERVDATFTTSEGYFSFSRYPNGTQYLRLSKPGFNTLLIKVEIRKHLKSQLNIGLDLSQ